MNRIDDLETPRNATAWGRLFRVCVVAIAIFHAVGLTRDMDEPWTGLHDGQGAFYSQLARSLLRHPLSVHHGLPLMALGEPVLSEGDVALDATQPPGLVWMMSPGFAVFGDAERVARLVPVSCSIITIVLFMILVSRLLGREAAVLSGVVYTLMPMAAYGGRSVCAEVACMPFMLAAILAWQGVEKPGILRRGRRVAIGLWLAAVAGCVWTHWLGALYAGLFCIYAIWAWRRGRLAGRALAVVLGGSVIFIGGLLSYLVYAGLGGRWGELALVMADQVFGLREGVNPNVVCNSGPFWDRYVQGFTGPILALAVLGVVSAAVQGVRVRGKPSSSDAPRLEGGPWGAAGILAVTVIAWCLVAGWRDRLPECWSFFTCPLVATGAGWGLLRLRNGLRRLGRRVANVGLAGGVVCLIHIGGVGGEAYHATSVYAPAEIEAWRGIHDLTRPDERILFCRNPFVEERYGNYCFRKVVPSQIAYYLDRPIGIEPDPALVPERAGEYAVFVWPVEDARGNGAALESLGEVFRVVQLGSELVFDLRGDGP